MLLPAFYHPRACFPALERSFQQNGRAAESKLPPDLVYQISLVGEVHGFLLLVNTMNVGGRMEAWVIYRILRSSNCSDSTKRFSSPVVMRWMPPHNLLQLKGRV